jgi:hypothetical protein
MSVSQYIGKYMAYRKFDETEIKCYIHNHIHQEIDHKNPY